MAAALEVHHEARFAACELFAELHGGDPTLLDVVHGIHHLAPHPRGGNTAAKGVRREKKLRRFPQISVKAINLTGCACKENKGTTIQIISNLLEALTHVALDQLCAHEPRQILFALDSCVDHPHIPVHGRAEHYTSGLQHKAGNGGKRTAGGGQPPLGLVLIPNSENTTDPAIAFRLLKEQLEAQVGKDEAKHRIIAITDASKGALRKLADKEGYKTFIIPDNVGGRFSVLTPVGLLPIAVAGYDIRQLVKGAVAMENKCGENVPFTENPAAVYAATRNILYKAGKKIEILVNFNPKLHFFAEWWKQLYGESEGKDHLGIYPASVDFTTDLHSMGQWIQDGERTIRETGLSVKKMKYKVLCMLKYTVKF